MYISFRNNILAALLTVFSTLALAEEAAPVAPIPVTDDDIAYFFGYRFGNALLEGGNENVSLDVVRQGLADSLARKEPNMSQEMQAQVIQEIQSRQIGVMAETAKAFMLANRSQDGIQETASGLQYQIIEEGEGDSPVAESEVVVQYEGRLLNNKVFDSSYQRGEPATFPLSNVIEGWTEGLQLMKPGGKARFFIPPELGYGPGGTGGAGGIPPFAVLVFDIQLIEVVAGEAPKATEADSAS